MCSMEIAAFTHRQLLTCTSWLCLCPVYQNVSHSLKQQGIHNVHVHVHWYLYNPLLDCTLIIIVMHQLLVASMHAHVLYCIYYQALGITVHVHNHWYVSVWCMCQYSPQWIRDYLCLEYSAMKFLNLIGQTEVSIRRRVLRGPIESLADG